MRHPDIWSLPGPRRFIDDLTSRMYKGRCINLRDRHGAEGILTALFSQLTRDSFVRVHSIDLSNAVEVLPALNEVLATNFSSLAALSAHETTQNTVFLLKVAGSVLSRDLQNFVRAARLRAGSDPGVIVTASSGLVEGLSGENWDVVDAIGLIAPLDGMAFAATRLSEGESLPVRVKAAIAVEVGGWDLFLTEKLLALPFKEAMRPDLNLIRWADATILSSASQLDRWGGEVSPHSAWLAQQDKDRLTKRVWRGQLAALFPWIEECRREVVARNHRVLQPDNRTMKDIDELDWGPLCIQLERSSNGCPPVARRARAIRNSLAHGVPVSWSDISNCIAEYTNWSGSRSV